MKKLLLLVLIFITTSSFASPNEEPDQLLAGTIWHTTVGTGKNRAEAILRFGRVDLICSYIHLEGGGGTSLINFTYTKEGNIITLTPIDPDMFGSKYEVLDRNALKGVDTESKFVRMECYDIYDSEVKKTTD